MFAPVISEMLKLRRSLALLLCASAPVLVILLTSLVVATRDEPTPWPIFTTNIAAIWALFMLPMTATALTILLAQFEHGPRCWNHLLALPVPKWRLFAAKTAVTVFLVAGMNLLLALLILPGGEVAERLADGPQLTGRVSFAAEVTRLAAMFQASLLLVAAQLWTALRFRSFVPPLVLGIAGTMVAIVASDSEWGVYFPWLMPANLLAEDMERAAIASAIGFWGGLAALAAAIFDLSRRELG